LAGVNYQTFASWIPKRCRARGDYAKYSASPGRQGKGDKGLLRLAKVRTPAAGIMLSQFDFQPDDFGVGFWAVGFGRRFVPQLLVRSAGVAVLHPLG
jgi:hypothetical protein